jgi:D-alanyl-D-alanine carboxypeptidase
MPVQRVARSLVSAGPAADDGKPVRLTPRAAAAWKRMRAAAAADGVDLLPLSGYRSVARQTRIIRKKLRAGQTITDILKLVAAPGCSEHHTGRAGPQLLANDPGLPGHRCRFGGQPEARRGLR